MIRFRFALTPLTEVQPWSGTGGVHSLGWFALSLGYYWIELDGHELLRYEGPPDWLPYVDYQVARLWEDLIDMTPMVMQPVPDDLVPFIAHNCDPLTKVDDEESRDAAWWHNTHALDLTYLLNPPTIWAWRTTTDEADVVTVAWQHHDSDDEDIRFTAPPRGQSSMPAGEFLDAVRRFDREFLDAMSPRVAEIERLSPPPGVQLDLRHLRAEQQDRSTWLSARLHEAPKTDWPAVRTGAQKLLPP